MADEAILTFLTVTAGGPIKVMNVGVAKANVKVEMWEVSAICFFFFFLISLGYLSHCTASGVAAEAAAQGVTACPRDGG
jgi:hypothetical protein